MNTDMTLPQEVVEMVLIQRRPLHHFRGRGRFHRVPSRARDRSFDERFVRPAERRWAEHTYMPLDVYATPEAFVIQSDVPGVRAEDVDITIEGDTLTIKAALPEPEEDVEYSVRERVSGAYERTLHLNFAVQPDAVDATFENGVLTLTVPKATEAKPKKIEIRVGK